MQTHRTLISRIYRTYRIVGVALLGCLVVSATSIRVMRWRNTRTRERLGIIADAPNEIFKSPLSPNKVWEIALDTNGDHKPDRWGVHIWEDESWRCDYFLDDLDFDGTPDVWKVGIGDFQAGFKLFDDDNDAKPDRLSVSVWDFSDKKAMYNYQDLNLDGIFDTTSRRTVSKTHGRTFWGRLVLLDGAWVATSTLPTDENYLREARIIREDGSEDKVIFDGGKWQIVE